MKKIALKAFLIFWIFFSPPLPGLDESTELQSREIVAKSIQTYTFPGISQSSEEKICESWMGIYMDGVKVGYSHSQKISLSRNEKIYKKSFNESCMKVSRMGGEPVEIVTIQEILYNEHGDPLESVLKVKMSENETVIRAEIDPERVLFKSGSKLVKELFYKEKFHLEAPIERIIGEEGFKPGKKYNFKILDPLSYSLMDSFFEIIGRERILILGKTMNLWHVRTETTFVVPVTIDDWIDDKGNSWKSVSQAGFATTTSILMSKEKALEASEESLDIAFSTLIKSNILFDRPQEIQRVTFKISGIPSNKIKKFPFDDRSQRILELGDNYAIIQTFSQVFREEEAILFPITDERFQKFLKPTSFCQSDDPEIHEVAKKIVEREKNSLRAAKKIVEWVKNEMNPNYDVGFASAKEILKNREGDCSEYTVLTITLCRSVGIPARAAVGIMYGQGIFAYHIWPEIYVGRWLNLDSRWLAVDKKSGEYYTDATHLKLGRSLLDENIFKEMMQAVYEIIGKLKLEIIDYYQDK